ncbi:MAG: DUF1559 domain-containing protein [Planctomycetes bacterium]|nr:DUF1559 domain-containing protein [Planctomycetota bacterium]
MVVAEQSTPLTANWDFKGEYWSHAEGGRGGGGYAHIVNPNRRSGTLDGRDVTTNVGASSLHPSGVHVLFCDGTVRFVGDTVDNAIWISIGTRANGEQIDNINTAF